MRIAWTTCTLLLGLGILPGCVKPYSEPAAQQPAAEPEAHSAAAPQAALPDAANTAPPAAPMPQATERVKAQVGVGKRGRSLDDETGVTTRAIVEPAKSLFAVRERAVFEIQIPQAMQLYKALEGQAPKTHDEFLQKIVQANNLKLPELPAGHKYVYDPQREELMVERPAR